MNKRPQTMEEAQAADTAYQQRLEKNVNGWLASIGRDFKDMEGDFAVLAERVRKGDLGGERVAISQSTLLHPVVVEMRDLYKAKHGRVYSIEQLKGLQHNLDSLAFRRDRVAHQQAMAADAEAAPERSMVTTDYARNAARLDKDKGGKAYWSTDCELFARAFDSFVADKLEASKRKIATSPSAYEKLRPCRSVRRETPSTRPSIRSSESLLSVNPSWDRHCSRRARISIPRCRSAKSTQKLSACAGSGKACHPCSLSAAPTICRLMCHPMSMGHTTTARSTWWQETLAICASCRR